MEICQLTTWQEHSSRLYPPIWVVTWEAFRLWSNGRALLFWLSSFSSNRKVLAFDSKWEAWNARTLLFERKWEDQNWRVLLFGTLHLITNGRIFLLQFKWEGTNGMASYFQCSYHEAIQKFWKTIQKGCNSILRGSITSKNDVSISKKHVKHNKCISNIGRG